MPFPSLFTPANRAQPWSAARAAVYGAGIGAAAALFKTVGPFRAGGSLPAHAMEIAGVAVVFAALCAAAALLRNSLARRFVWPDLR